jgi:hypothetical protein
MEDIKIRIEKGGWSATDGTDNRNFHVMVEFKGDVTLVTIVRDLDKINKIPSRIVGK